MTSTDKAYIAGLIDGEGTIGIYKTRRENNRETFRLRLRVSNTNLDILLWLQSKFNLGRIAISQKEGQFYHRKPVYGWDLANFTSVEIVLKAVFRYLRLKRNIAEVALNYIANRRRLKSGYMNRGKGRWPSFSDEDRRLYQKAVMLNKKGPSI